jgi:hypothetical protein
MRHLKLFDTDWGFHEVIHGTRTVLKRDPRLNFMENIAFLGLLVDVPYTINIKKEIYIWN